VKFLRDFTAAFGSAGMVFACHLHIPAKQADMPENCVIIRGDDHFGESAAPDRLFIYAPDHGLSIDDHKRFPRKTRRGVSRWNNSQNLHLVSINPITGIPHLE
jgi:hypothetical protein